MPAIQEARPPYVEFKQVAVEDRNASIEQGRRVAKNINMAYVMQIGSKDQTEKIAEDWLAQLKRKSVEGEYPEAWVKHFDAKFQDWLAGRESPENGYPIREWAVLSPAEVENLLEMKIRTVEDLAAATEELLQKNLGLRTLKQKAQAWLESANSGAEQLAALKIENEQLKDTIERMNERLQAVEADKPKRGRPPKDE
jgi:FtsZ-binding cell division protein ZapB